MSAVLRPTFYVALFCILSTIFNFYPFFSVRPVFIRVNRWSVFL